MKTCKHCGEEFEKRCKPCHAATMRQWRKDNPERAKEISRKGYKKWSSLNLEEKRKRGRDWARYNYDPETAKKTRTKHTLKQLGLSEVDIRPCPDFCECCGGPPIEGKRLCIDHCHVTNTFRGWLCHKCNTGIGSLGDNTEGVQNAINYLMKDK